MRGLRLYFPELEPWVARSASLPMVRPGLSMLECGAAGCYLPLCLPRSPPLFESGPLGLSVRECGAAGSASGQTACAFVPHSASLGPATPQCPSPPLLPVWMNVYFLFPWCRTPLPFDSLSVLVVRGGTVCLPTPPSWFFTQTFLQCTVSERSYATPISRDE